MAANCVNVNDIGELASILGDSREVVAGLVGLWRQRTGQQEELPSPDDLIAFKTSLRQNTGSIHRDKYIEANLAFSPAVRTQRAQYIARVFNYCLQDIREEYANRGKNIGTFRALKEYGPQRLIAEIRDMFNPELLTYEDAEGALNANRRSTTKEEVNKHLEYMKEQYRLIQEHFTVLFEEATKYIANRNRILITFNTDRLIDFKGNDIDSEEIIKDSDEMDKKENATKEGWMSNVLKISSYDRVSPIVRAFLDEIPKVDEKGVQIVDDLLEPIYMESNMVFTIIQKLLSDMTNSRQMLPMLEKALSERPWLRFVIRKLKRDKKFASLFYRGFNTSTNRYWVQNEVSINGKRTPQLVDTLKSEDKGALLDEIRANRESGTLLNPDSSSYNVDGTDNTEARTELMQDAHNLYNEFYIKIARKMGGEQSSEQLTKWFNDHVGEIADIFNSLGIPMTEEQLKDEFTQIHQQKKVVADTLRTLETLLSIKPEANKDWVNSNMTNLKKLLDSWFEEQDLPDETSTSQQGSTYYTKTSPSYISVLFDKLAGKGMTEQEYQDYLYSNYFISKYWFFEDGEANSWLQMLKEDASARKAIDRIQVLYRNGIPYEEWTPDLTLKVLFDQYFGRMDQYEKSDTAYFPIPIFANAQSMQFVRFKRLKSTKNKSLKEIAYPKFQHVILQEFNRIQLVAQRKDSGAVTIQNFDTNGDRFNFFPILNTLQLQDGRNFYEALFSAVQANDALSIEKICNEGTDAILEDYIQDFKQTLKNLQLEEYFTDQGYNIEDYITNVAYANTQITQLGAVDLAFFKDNKDFQKRFKGLYSPKQALNTESQYGQRYGKAIYLKDWKMASTVLDDIKEVLQQAVNEGQMSKETYDAVINKYSNMNITDGQSFRTLKAYRAFKDMIGEWTDEMEVAFKRWEKGEKLQPHELNIMFNPTKPMYWGIHDSSTEIDREGTKQDDIIKIPTFYKNSEAPLLAIYQAVAGITAKSPILLALNKFMDDHNIDVVHFESVVKVGLQGAIEVSGMDAPQMLQELESKCYPNGINNEADPNYVHTFDYENMGLSQPTPEHVVDAVQAIGSQVVSVLMGDTMDTEFIHKGEKKTGRELMKDIVEITSKQLDLKMREIKEEIGSTSNLMEILKASIKQDGGFNTQLLNYLTKRADGSYRPLSNPIIGRKIQQVVMSIIRNNLIKRDVDGGSVVQVSNFGFADDLKIEFGVDENGKKYIEALECYMPAYSRKFFKPEFMDKDGNVDIEKIRKQSPELLELIGYRIPTEGKYSILKLKIKGFTSQANGGIAILPSELTTLNDSDFDIDKLYLFLKAFKYNKETKSLEIINDDSVEGLNNQLFDIFSTVLKSPEVARMALEGGGFPNGKKAAIRIDELMGRTSEQYNPINPTTFMKLHQLNMMGVNGVGIYANQRKAHSTSQELQTEINKTYSFALYGRRLTSLHEKFNIYGELNSRNGGELIAASADTAKDPILNSLGFDDFTADIAAFLLRLGYSTYEVGILMNQPVVKRASSIYMHMDNRGLEKGEAFRVATNSILNMGQGKYNILEHVEEIRSHDFKLSELEKAIDKNTKEIDWQTQIYLGQLLYYMSDTLVTPVTKASMIKPDTSSSAVGTSNYSVLSKLSQTESLQDQLDHTTVYNNLLFTQVQDSYMNLYYEKIIQKIPELLSGHFVEYSPVFRGAIDRIVTTSGRKSTKLIGNICDNLFTYLLSGTPFFGNEVTESGELITLADKRFFYKYRFPRIIEQAKAKYPELREMTLIKNLNKKSQGKMYFRLSGKMSPVVRETIAKEWESLLFHPDPTVNKIGFDLFRWSFFEYGFNNNNQGILRFAPTLLQDMIPGLYETVERTRTLSVRDVASFITYQYTANHTDNPSLSKLILNAAEQGIRISNNGFNTSAASPVRSLVRRKTKMGVELWPFVKIGKQVYYTDQVPHVTNKMIYDPNTKKSVPGETLEFSYRLVTPLENTYDPYSPYAQSKRYTELIMKEDSQDRDYIETITLDMGDRLDVRFGYDFAGNQKVVAAVESVIGEKLDKQVEKKVEINDVEPKVTEDVENRVPCNPVDPPISKASNKNKFFGGNFGISGVDEVSMYQK